MKILFIGILTEDVLDQTRAEGLIGTLVDVREAAAEVGRICNTHNAIDIDLTILLTHIGFEEDQQLAEMLDPAWGVDAIIGGHSHTFIEEPAVVNGVPIVQAGTGTDQIGRFDIMVDVNRNTIDSFTWKAVPINASTCPRDTDLERVLNQYKSATDEKFGRVLSRLARKLTHPVRTQETELGNLFADIMRDQLGVDIMVMGSGSLRVEAMGPVVTMSDLSVAFPYDDPCYMLKVTGAQFKEMIRYIVREETWAGEHTEYYQLSHGPRITYDRASREFTQFLFEGKPMEDERLYSIALQKYHFLNFTKFFGVPFEDVEKNGKARVLATSCLEILEEYLTDHQLEDRHIEGRLKVEHP